MGLDEKVSLALSLLSSSSMDSRESVVFDWKTELPQLTGGIVVLREPVPEDLGPLIDLFSIGDAVRFGLDYPVTGPAVRELIDRARERRAAGVSFTYVITVAPRRAVVGVIQVRQLDPSFETAEWECTIAPSSRGTGVFVEAARLVGSFTFGSVGAHRIESRVPLRNGRANRELGKLGAVQEGILRRSLRQGDEYLDQILWAVLNEEWSDRWVAPAPRIH